MDVTGIIILMKIISSNEYTEIPKNADLKDTEWLIFVRTC